MEENTAKGLAIGMKVAHPNLYERLNSKKSPTQLSQQSFLLSYDLERVTAGLTSFCAILSRSATAGDSFYEQVTIIDTTQCGRFRRSINK
jgi:hypothetical protein